MSQYDFYVDLHCHPAMKPFGKSFNKKNRKNSTKLSDRSSIWHQQTPNIFKKIINTLGSLTKFTQSDCTTLFKGGVHVVCASLYPLEKGFVKNKLGQNMISDIPLNLLTGIGDKRIDYLQNLDSYFKDLEEEYQFYQQLDGVVVKVDNQHKVRYKIVRSYDEILSYVDTNPNSDVITICLLLTIEGMHVLDCGLYGANSSSDINLLKENTDKIKNWQHSPFFVTLAHHFWNELCGHAKSLVGIADCVTNQEYGIGEGFTEKGKIILHQLLENKNGKRILIDIKHMSVKAREEYYQILKEEYASENIPIIISHGAMNGLTSPTNPSLSSIKTGRFFYKEDINFYDSEIVEVAQSGGIMGLQMDERRLISREALKNVKRSIRRHMLLHYRSEIVWNQIKHIAEVLDKHNLPAWNNIAIGSDYDGIIDPLNGFWTASEMDLLASYLERHAENYFKDANCPLDRENKILPSEVISRVMSSNALQFLEKHFKS